MDTNFQIYLLTPLTLNEQTNLLKSKKVRLQVIYKLMLMGSVKDHCYWILFVHLQHFFNFLNFKSFSFLIAIITIIL